MSPWSTSKCSHRMQGIWLCYLNRIMLSAASTRCLGMIHRCPVTENPMGQNLLWTNAFRWLIKINKGILPGIKTKTRDKYKKHRVGQKNISPSGLFEAGSKFHCPHHHFTRVFTSFPTFSFPRLYPQLTPTEPSGGFVSGAIQITGHTSNKRIPPHNLTQVSWSIIQDIISK